MYWFYMLVDVDWDCWIGDVKMKELVDYVCCKGVGIFVWYNFLGDWNDMFYIFKSVLLMLVDWVCEFV